MKELTREEWMEIARRLGVAADQLDAFINQGIASFQKLKELEGEFQCAEQEEVEATLQEWRKLEEAMRLAVGAVLWVGENAADRVRFMMLDSHPPDGE